MSKSKKREKHKSVAEEVAAKIATLIGKRILNAGEHLVENDLVEKFKVSRATVREALSMLERDKLVEKIPYRGVRVRTYTTKEIHDLYDTIYGLETMAMEKALITVKEHDIKVLEKILVDQKAALDNSDVEKYYRLNEKYHQYIFEISENIFLMDLYKRLHRVARPFRLLTLAQSDNMQSSYIEHVQQKEALKEKDMSMASSAIVNQKERSLKALNLLFPEED